MKTQKTETKPSAPTQWLTLEEVKLIIRRKSRGAVRSFVIRHTIRVNRSTGQNLYPSHEIHEALNRGAVRMGV